MPLGFVCAGAGFGADAVVFGRVPLGFTYSGVGFGAVPFGRSSDANYMVMFFGGQHWQQELPKKI